MLIGAVVIGVVGVTVTLLLRELAPVTAGAGTPWSALGLSPSELEGVTLSAPLASSTPAVGQPAAEAVALQGPVIGANVLKSTLAQTVFTNQDNRRCLCWVVSLMPPGGDILPKGGYFPNDPATYQAHHAVFKYYLVFVDATTGKFVVATNRSD